MRNEVLVENIEAGRFHAPFVAHGLTLAGVHEGKVPDGELPPTEHAFVATENGVGVDVLGLLVEETEQGPELDIDIRKTSFVEDNPEEVQTLIRTVVSAECELSTSEIHIRRVVQRSPVPEGVLETIGVKQEFLPLPTAA